MLLQRALALCRFLYAHCMPLPKLLDCARPLASVEIPVLNLSRRRNPAIRVAIPNQEIFKLLPAFVTQASLNL